MDATLSRPRSFFCRILARATLSMMGVVSLASAQTAAEYETKIKPILDEYCFGCHADGAKRGDFVMDQYGSLQEHLQDRDHWHHIWMNLRSQIMPPFDEAQLTAAEKSEVMRWIEKVVFKLDEKNPDPGRVTIRRLNRMEYQNAVMDLLGVEFDTFDFFPADDTGYGFDNIGDVLSISPLLMEKYIEAADLVVNMALPDDASAQAPRREILASAFSSAQKKGVASTWLPFKEEGKTSAKLFAEWDGKYRVTVQYNVRGALEATTQEALLKVRLAGELLGEETLGWDQRKVIEFVKEVDLSKGDHPLEVEIAPLKDPAGDEEEMALSVLRVIVQGPLGGEQVENAKGYSMIFVDGAPPEEAEEKDRYAQKIMQSFVSRAFRRPLDHASMKRLTDIVKEIDALPGKTFEDGIKAAIATCLCSPRFLFRIEIQPEPNNPQKVVPLDDYSLASRLSFFLWGSVPDDELLSLAFNKQLRANLPAQIERMLADPRSNRLVKNFVGQWLQVRDLATLPIEAGAIMGIESKREASLAFDVRLRDDMRTETEMLFDFVLRNKRPAEELISARYSFLNERLAGFYDIKGVEGEEFRPVDLTQYPHRGGILTQGSYLIISSNPSRTSPVKRGLFVLDNLLATPAPPAPPNVPELESAAEQVKGEPTMREMMEIHRKNPDCRGCHARMDPIGLGLENYDALGRFRASEHGKAIDSAGVLVTGEEFSSAADLKSVLASERKEDFYRSLSEKLLTFAIGRGIEYYDAPTIDALVASLESSNGSLEELVSAIIHSAPFQKRRGDH